MTFSQTENGLLESLKRNLLPASRLISSKPGIVLQTDSKWTYTTSKYSCLINNGKRDQPLPYKGRLRKSTDFQGQTYSLVPNPGSAISEFERSRKIRAIASL